jgi:hypothetical protein
MPKSKEKPIKEVEPEEQAEEPEEESDEEKKTLDEIFREEFAMCDAVSNSQPNKINTMLDVKERLIRILGKIKISKKIEEV